MCHTRYCFLRHPESAVMRNTVGCAIRLCSYRLVSSRKKKSELERDTEKKNMFWKLKYYIAVEMQNKLMKQLCCLCVRKLLSSASVEMSQEVQFRA